ncbi:MAG: four helix bundle protein [Candidatus Moraniibacteriota bacterium]|nr:MAG: four helix bundle protein [Candidatus Moranbacteria bacterium]
MLCPPLASFEELIVWQRSMELAGAVYLGTEALPKSEQYGLMKSDVPFCSFYILPILLKAI